MLGENLHTHITDRLTRHLACFKESHVRKHTEPPIKEGVISIREVQLHCHRHCWKVFAKPCHKNVMHADKRNRRVDNQALGWQEELQLNRNLTLLPARERLRRSTLKHSMKMTGILYLPSMAANLLTCNLSGQDDNITDVWFGLFLFAWGFGGGCFLIKRKHFLRSSGCF